MKCPICSFTTTGSNQPRNIERHIRNQHATATECPICRESLTIDEFACHVTDHLRRRFRSKRARVRAREELIELEVREHEETKELVAAPNDQEETKETLAASIEQESEEDSNVAEELYQDSFEESDSFELEPEEDVELSSDDANSQDEQVRIDIDKKMQEFYSWRDNHLPRIELALWALHHNVSTSAYRSLKNLHILHSSKDFQSLPSELNNLYRSLSPLIRSFVGIRSADYFVRLQHILSYWWMHPSLHDVFESRCKISAISEQIGQEDGCYPYSSPNYRKGFYEIEKKFNTQSTYLLSLFVCSDGATLFRKKKKSSVLLMLCPAEFPLSCRASPSSPGNVLAGIIFKKQLTEVGVEEWLKPLTEGLIHGWRGFIFGQTTIVVRFLSFVGDSPAQSDLSGHHQMTSKSIQPCPLCSIARHQLAETRPFPRRQHQDLLEAAKRLPNEMQWRANEPVATTTVIFGDRRGLRYRSPAVFWPGFDYTTCRTIELLHLEPQGNISSHICKLAQGDEAEFWKKLSEQTKRIRFS